MYRLVDSPDQLACGCFFLQRAGLPLDSVGLILDPATDTGRPIPAAETMTRVREVPHDAVTEEVCGTRDGDAHTELRQRDRNRAWSLWLL